MDSSLTASYKLNYDFMRFMNSTLRKIYPREVKHILTQRLPCECLSQFYSQLPKPRNIPNAQQLANVQAKYSIFIQWDTIQQLKVSNY